MTNPTPTLTHAERAERRRRIAEHVRDNGCSISEAARHFGVSVNMVRDSCHEHGVAFTDGRSAQPLGVSTYRIILALLKGEEQASVSRRMRVSPQRVSEIAGSLREAERCEQGGSDDA